MTQIETAKVMTILSAAYPYFYSKQTREEKADALMLWSDMFSEEPLDIVLVAVKSLIANHSEFPPNIADVKKEYARVVSVASGEQTNDELWLLYSKACSNGTYDSVNEFDKLPDILKRYCGSPNHLREMAMIESDIFNTVTRGQFAKNLEIARERERYNRALSPAMKSLIQQATNKMKMPELAEGNDD